MSVHRKLEDIAKELEHVARGLFRNGLEPQKAACKIESCARSLKDLVRKVKRLAHEAQKTS